MMRMIGAHFLMFVALIALATGGGACASSKTDQTASARKTKTAGPAVLHTGRQGNNGQVSLLARAFLPSSAKAHSGFAYYGYLVFTDSSPASAFARRTASKFYLGMLAQVNTARESAGTRRENMAVLYLPLNDSATAEALIKEQDAQGVVAAYDYTRARAISNQLKRAGKTIPSVAIIGSTRPLGTGDAPGTLDVVDLTDPGTVAERMEHFRDALETRERPVSEDVVLKRLRAYFAWADSAAHDGPTQLTF
jgi:hypothetical protein